MINIYSIEYEINAQSWRDGQFSVPKKVADTLNIKPNDKALIEVSSNKGTKSFIVTIKSGLEVYGLKEHIESGELLRVKVSHEPVVN